MKQALTVIIVSFNTRVVLEKCLKVLSQEILESRIPTEVIVVDNNSTDGSPDLVKHHFPLFSLITNKTNLGFGSANNQAVAKAQGDYLLLLNSDAFLMEGAVKKIYDFITNHKEVDIAGGKLLNINQTVQQSVGYIPTPLRVFSWMLFIDNFALLQPIFKPYHVKNTKFYEKEQAVDWVTGALLLVKKETFVKAGGFDPQMFMYVEEVDLCFRIKKNGGHIVYTPQFSAVHLKGKSSTSSTAGLLEEFKGIKYFYQKHYPGFPQYLLSAILKLGALLRLILFAIMGNRQKRAIYGKTFKVG